MSDSESDNEEFTIGNDLVVTKYKMAGDIANRWVIVFVLSSYC